MDVISALLFLAACPSLCMGHRLRNSDALSLSVEAAPEFCAAEALPVRRMPNPAFIFAFELVGHSVAFERWRSKRLHTGAFVFWLACCSLLRK
jgi:hypothetical protein